MQANQSQSNPRHELTGIAVEMLQHLMETPAHHNRSAGICSRFFWLLNAVHIIVLPPVPSRQVHRIR